MLELIKKGFFGGIIEISKCLCLIHPVRKIPQDSYDSIDLPVPMINI